MKRTIKLNERELRQLISESVKAILNENTGFKDGVKGAMNGIRGGMGIRNSMQNAVQGFRQGAQGQQEQSRKEGQEHILRVLKELQSHANKALQYAQQGNINGAIDIVVDCILVDAEDIKETGYPTVVDYRNGQMDTYSNISKW
jgi:hypothetical protein